MYVQVSRVFPAARNAARELNPLSAKSPRTTAQHPFECLPEFRREHSVNQGVEGTVEVSEPQEHTCHQLGRLAGLAYGLCQSGQEERQPARDECAGDDHQSLGRLSLALRLDCLARVLRALHDLLLLARAGRIRQRSCCGRRRDRRGGHRRRRCHVRTVVRRWLLRRDGRVIRSGSRDGKRCRLLARPTARQTRIILVRKKREKLVLLPRYRENNADAWDDIMPILFLWKTIGERSRRRSFGYKVCQIRL